MPEGTGLITVVEGLEIMFGMTLYIMQKIGVMYIEKVSKVLINGAIDALLALKVLQSHPRIW